MDTKLYLPDMPESPMFVNDTMTMEWHEFFRSLFQRVGGTDTISLDDLFLAVITEVFSTEKSYDKLIKAIEAQLHIIPTEKNYETRISQLEMQLHTTPIKKDYETRISQLEMQLNALPLQKNYEEQINQLKAQFFGAPAPKNYGASESFGANPTFETVTIKSDAPTLILHNTSEEDTDGGRESEIRFKGEQSGGEETTLALIKAEHELNLDDEKGELTISVNEGVNGNTPADKEVFTSGSIQVLESFSVQDIVNTSEHFRVDGVQVVINQGAVVADATDAATAITQLNALLACMRVHGLIDT